MAKRAVRGQKAIKSVPKRTPNINTVPQSPAEEGPGYKIDVRELSSGKHGDDPYGLGAEKPMLLAQDVDSLQNAGAILDGSFQDESERMHTMQDSMEGTKIGEFMEGADKPIDLLSHRSVRVNLPAAKLGARDATSAEKKLTKVVKDEIADKKAKEKAHVLDDLRKSKANKPLATDGDEHRDKEPSQLEINKDSADGDSSAPKQSNWLAKIR